MACRPEPLTIVESAAIKDAADNPIENCKFVLNPEPADKDHGESSVLHCTLLNPPD